MFGSCALPDSFIEVVAVEDGLTKILLVRVRNGFLQTTLLVGKLFEAF